ncbi:MAG: hypothetical protein ACI8UZ_001674 [Akkermansiaceae bacterium]|jgi:hypothetical protein
MKKPMKFLFTSAKASCLVGLLSLCSATPAVGASSSDGAGEVAIYSEATGADVITTFDFTHDFDTSDREDAGSFTRAGADITLNRDGHYLAIYDSRFNGAPQAGTEERVEVQSCLNLAGTKLPIGWSQGFIRRQQGHLDAITTGMAVIEATANDVLQLQSFRTDTTTIGSVTRFAGDTAIQLVKLDDVNMSYARLSLAANQTGPAVNGAAVKVVYDTNDELDTGFSYASGNLTLADAGKYLVIANTYIVGYNNRHGFIQELTLDGTAISGTRTNIYLRGSQSTIEGAAAIGTIIETTAANQVLSVLGELDGGSGVTNFIADRCGLTVVKLPSAAAGTSMVDPDFIRLSHSANQNVNATADIIFDTQSELDAEFAHSPNSSDITVATGGDYLFLGSFYGADDGAARGLPNLGWAINGTRLNRGQSGRYTRNTGPPEFGNTLGLVASGLAASDQIKMVTRALAAGGTNNANPMALQGVRLASLFTSAAAFEITVVPTAIATTEGGAIGTYDLALGLAPAAAGAVTVTISPDAQSEVSTDGTNFFSTLAVVFSNTTPQTITVRAADDAAIESAHSSTITHAITASTDPTNYPLSQPVASVANSITDNDVVPVNAVADSSTSNVSEDAMANQSIISPQSDLLANDTAGLNNVVSASDSMSAFGAAVSVNPDGTFTYDPTKAGGAQMIAAGATGIDTFSYTARDEDGNTDSTTVSLTVDGANDLPSATSDRLNDGPLETATSFVSAANLTANDGIFNNVTTTFTLPAGSDLRLFPGKVFTQAPSVGAPPGGGTPGRGMDGNPATFTHTDSNDNSANHTWQVNFGQEVSLEDITLTNRQDCCADRLRDIVVKVLDGTGTNVFSSTTLNEGNAMGFANAAGGTLFVDFPAALMGQTVLVERIVDTTAGVTVNESSILSLGEVTIIGSAPGTFAQVDEFLVASHDASTSVGAAGRWENIGSGGGTNADWLLGSGVTLNSSVTSAHAQITGAYEWDGTTNATGSLVGGSINGIYGDAVDKGSSAIEIWAKLDPADLTQISTLFETGGGTGVGLVIDNGILRVANGINVGAVSYDLTTDPDTVLLGAATAEFFQVVMVMDFAGDLTLLYVNGTLVGTNSNSTADWDGGDASGLGHYGGDNHGGFQNGAATTSYDTYFNGSMASFRVYSTALSDAQVAQNYKAVNSGTDIDGDSLSVVGVLDGGDTFVVNGSPAILLSGAIVTMNNATGGFDYNPNGAYSLLPGDTATDTFTYRVSDGNGGTAEADVTVTITGVATPIDDNLLAKEDELKIYTPNELVKNDETAATPGAYLNLNPGSFAAPTWTNQGSAGAAFNATITGSLVEAPDLMSGFELIGCAASAANLATLDPISTGSATLEIWFMPEAGQTGKKTIFDTGGNGNGFSIVYDPATNEVTANVDGGDDATANITATASGVSTTEFNQFIVVIQPNAGAEVGVGTGIFEDLLTIYLNNDRLAAFDATVDGSGINALGIANDWAGTDNGGLNKTQGTTAFDENFPAMVGEVAIFRAYSSVLTTTQMEANFNASIQPITLVSSLSAVQGVNVTLNGDGTVTVDYSGISLAVGASLMDSFTYTTAGGTATANIVIEGNTINEDWRFLYFGDTANSGPGADSATGINGETNLVNLALDLDPTAAGGVLDVDQGTSTITTLGPPVFWIDPATGRRYLRYTRRADFAAIPLTIAAQFSRDLTSFENSSEIPTVIATGTGDSGVAIEAVQVEFPLILPVSGAKARHGVVEVTTP